MFKTVLFLGLLKKVNLLKFNNFQGLFKGFPLVDIKEKSVADTLNFAEALDDEIDFSDSSKEKEKNLTSSSPKPKSEKKKKL